MRILIEFEDEWERRGSFELLYPLGDDSSNSMLNAMRDPLYSNLLLAAWQRVYSTDEKTRHEAGIRILEEYCAKALHLTVIAEDANGEDNNATITTMSADVGFNGG